MLNRFLRQTAGQTTPLLRQPAHVLQQLFERRWARFAALAAVAAAGPVYALAAPSALTNDSNLRSAAAIQPGASASGGLPDQQADQPAAAKADGSSASNQASTTLDLSMSSSSGLHTSVTVNGKRAVVPPGSVLSQHTVSNNGAVSINISSDSSNVTGHSNSISSLDVDVQSKSSGG